MKRARITQLKNHLSRYLDYVRRGGTVRVFDRDHPIVDLVPVSLARAAGPEGLEAILAHLERQGVVRRGSGRLPRGFLTRKLPRPRASVVQALLEQREAGR